MNALWKSFLSFSLFLGTLPLFAQEENPVFNQVPHEEFKLVSKVPLPQTQKQKPKSERYGESYQTWKNLEEKPRISEWQTTQFSSRFVYLNGVNISDLTNQKLSNVTIKIDTSGNIHIMAPHYEVRQQESFHPLLKQEIPQFSKNQNQKPLGSVSKTRSMELSFKKQPPPKSP